MNRKTRIRLIAVTLAIVVGLPVLGYWVRRGGPPRCAYDGLRIEPVYCVTIYFGRDEARGAEFCCVRCAERWREKHYDSAIWVTDETSGEPVPAEDAWYVRSTVITNRVTGNRIHVFRNRADAERHAEAFHGDLLTGSERPFARIDQNQDKK